MYSHCLKVFLFWLISRGFPVWLKYVPDIAFRTDNEPFKVGIFNFTRSYCCCYLIMKFCEFSQQPFNFRNDVGSNAKIY